LIKRLFEPRLNFSGVPIYLKTGALPFGEGNVLAIVHFCEGGYLYERGEKRQKILKKREERLKR
jgi:hypothetical protein